VRAAFRRPDQPDEATLTKHETPKRAHEGLRSDIFMPDCEVEGEIPSGLAGALVRLGGEWFYPPRFPDDAPLHSDGYISTFTLGGGRASFRGKYVRTPRFQANLSAGRQLFGYYRNRGTDDPSVRHLDGTVANTTPMVLAGKLFALKEDALPYRIDPVTLDTLGPHDFGGAYKAPTFTAHPKRDHATGETIAFGYEATGPASRDVFLYTIDRAGQVTHEVRFQVPYTSVMHDMAITDRHVIFPFCAYTTSPERLAEGRIHWGWDPSLPSYIGIIPRGGDAKDMRWFKGPQMCMMHTLNARTEGDKVVLEAPFYEGNFFPFFPNTDGSPFDPTKARAFIRRMTFDLSSNKDSWDEEILFPGPVSDLARIDERFTGRDNRYAFASFRDASRPFTGTAPPFPIGWLSNTYGRFDLKDRTFESALIGDSYHLQEPVFVPRTAGGDESDGWLLGVANDYRDHRSELVILDAQRIAEGPIGKVLMPFFAGPQVHCTWAAAGVFSE
jgi:carotenoid cleavage dioxygenase